MSLILRYMLIYRTTLAVEYCTEHFCSYRKPLGNPIPAFSSSLLPAFSTLEVSAKVGGVSRGGESQTCALFPLFTLQERCPDLGVGVISSLRMLPGTRSLG